MEHSLQMQFEKEKFYIKKFVKLIFLYNNSITIDREML